VTALERAARQCVAVAVTWTAAGWVVVNVPSYEEPANGWISLGSELGLYQFGRGRRARCADLSLGDAVAGASRANADDCLSLAALRRVEGGDGVVEGRDSADVCPQPAIPYPLDDLIELATIGLDNEVDR
jgi:hypothetical protein